MPKEIEMFFRDDEARINVEGWLKADHQRGWLTIHKNKQCQICKENKSVFEIDTSGHEYGSIFYCLDCLSILMERYKKNDAHNYDVAEIKKRVEQISPRSCCQNHWLEDYLKLDEKDKDFIFRPFIVCSVCGNKRCPKATDCTLDCHGSNAEGQPGSIYA